MKPDISAYGELLRRQVRKFLTDEELNNPRVQQMLAAVNVSYGAFQRDQELVNHAFAMSEMEFGEVNERLKHELTIKQMGIRNLKEAIRSLAETEEEIAGINVDGENPLDAFDFLQKQIERRKQVEEDLTDSRNQLDTTARRFAQLISNIQSGILVEDENRRIVLVNELFCRMFHIPMEPGQMLGFDCALLADEGKVAFEDGEGFVRRIDEILAKRELVLNELLETKSGVILERDYIPIFIGEDYKGHFWKYTDVTEETRNKLELERLSALASANESGVVFTDREGRIFWTNDGFARMTGYAMDEIVGKTPIELCRGAMTDKQALREMLDAFFSGRSFDVDLIHYRKDGSWFYGRSKGQASRNADGEITHYFAMVEDVSELKRKELELQRSEEKYRNIIANMNLGLLEVDNQERIVYANQSFCEMCGYEEEELLGKTASELFVRGENHEMMQAKNQLRINGISDAYEISTRNKRGDALWWLVSGAPRYDDAGKQTGSIGIHLDITRQKELESEMVRARNDAEESALAKEVFLANMSHEIRTPMNGIVGMVRELGKTDLDEHQRFYLETVRSAADNLLVILNDILDLTKIEAGKLDVESVPFEFKPTMKHACQVMKPKAEEKGLIMTSKLDPEIAHTVVGDPYRLNQVLLNLIGNAIKFTEHGRIDLFAKLVRRSDGEQVVSMTVRDTGIGMDPAYIHQIFDKFSQEDRSTARQYGGTGLGMNITKQLVTLMGGEIDVKTQKGVGTEVVVTIPFGIPLEEEGAGNRESQDTADHDLLRGKRILIAEDNELNRLVLETTLRHYDLQLQFATNGKEAVEALEASTFDLVLMDVQMPVMSGTDATTVIRNGLKLEVPIIALTANVLKGDSERYKALGMNDFVPKPFEEEDLLDVLCRWLAPSLQASDLDPKGASPSSGKSDYSLDKLRKISRGNEEFVGRMVRLFVDQCDDTIRGMEQAVAAADWDKLSHLAHRIKPSLDSLEVARLYQIVRDLESLPKANLSEQEKSTVAAEQLEVFSHHLRRVASLLRDAELPS